jgi:hypothetical protein
MNICFYNQWHNGDVFSGKGWINHIIKSISNHNYAYAHACNEKVMKDVKAQYFHSHNLPDVLKYNHPIKLAEGDNDVLFINTWVGAYIHEVMLSGEQHANWRSLHKMWGMIIDALNKRLNCNIELSDNPLDYVATTDWSSYDIAKVESYVGTNARKHLFCNGLVRSKQSKIMEMQNIIEKLADMLPEDTFFCTNKFENARNNIYFTGDIFNLENDINEIAYLSTFCDTIIGKNSGPFMFCHVKDNVFDENKRFISLSERPNDSYAFGVKGFNCEYIHSIIDDDKKLIDIIYKAINSPKLNLKEIQIV